MKKDLWVKLAGLAIVLTLISATLVSGTYAKYVKAVTGADTARVAKFAFNLKGDGATLATQSETLQADFDIFDYTDEGVYADGLNGQKFIAPGTHGSLALSVENLSEVDVTATLTIGETNENGIPIYYTIGADTQRYSSVLGGAYTGDGGGTYKTMGQLSTEIAAVVGTLEATDNSTETTTALVTLNWAWEFNPDAAIGQTNDTDTALGIAGTAQVTLSVVVTVAQVD